MVKILFFRNWKKEKGLTLVEVIVSLSILIIVSIVTVSLAVFSTTATQKGAIKQYFMQEIDNISNLYLSYDEADFVESISFSLGINLTGYNDYTSYLDSMFNILDSDEGAKYRLVFDFDGNTSLTMFSYNGVDSLIYSRSVTK